MLHIKYWFTFLLFLAGPGIILKCFSAIRCHDLQNIEYLYSDYSTKCWSPVHFITMTNALILGSLYILSVLKSLIIPIILQRKRLYPILRSLKAVKKFIVTLKNHDHHRSTLLLSTSLNPLFSYQLLLTPKESWTHSISDCSSTIVIKMLLLHMKYKKDNYY